MFFQNFFHKCELCIVNSKNYFDFEKIFVLKLFKILTNQCAPDLNRDLSSNFWWLRSANHMKFIEEYVMWLEKHALVKTNIYQWAKYGFAFWSLNKKDNLWSGNTDKGSRHSGQ